MKKNLALFLVFVLNTSSVILSQTTPVTFNVDMNYKISIGEFDPGTETVDVAGSFNDWGGNPLDLSDPESDGIYTITLDIDTNTHQEYKFRINRDWGNSEFPDGGNNRNIWVGTDPMTINHLYNEYITDIDLLAFFPLNGDVDERSGMGISGILNGGWFTEDRNNYYNPGALYLDGSSYANFGETVSIIDGLDNFSISIWVNPDNLNPGHNILLASHTGVDSSYLMSVKDNNMFFSYYSGAIYNEIMGGPVKPGMWQHFVITKNGTDLNLYRNNQLINSITCGGAVDNIAHNLYIGTWDDSDNFYNGLIDDIRYYDRSLSEEEIQRISYIKQFEFDYEPDFDLAISGNANNLAGNHCSLTANETIEVEIYNNGLQTFDDIIDLNYSIDAGSTWDNHVIGPVVIQPGETYIVEITGIDLSTPGIIEYIVMSELNLADEDAGNNISGSTMIRHLETINTFPHIQNFEAGYESWFAEGQDPSWEVVSGGGHIGYPAEGSTYATTNPSGGFNFNEQSWVESPCFDFTSVSHPYIQFNLWAHTGPDAAAMVQYSTDGGASWNDIGSTGEQYWANADFNYFDGDSQHPSWWGVNNDWGFYRHIIDELAGMSGVRFRFYFGAFEHSDTEMYDGVGIDNILIGEAPDPDVGIIWMDNYSDCGLADYNIAFRLKNFGSADISNIPVTYTIDGGAPVQETFLTAGVLSPGQEQDFSFTDPVVLDIPGQRYYFDLWTSLSGDTMDYNNGLQTHVTHQPIINTYPYLADFEGLEEGWVAENDQGEYWNLSEAVGYFDHGSGYFWQTNPGTGYKEGCYYLMSPCYDLTSLSSAFVEFDLWLDMPDYYGSVILLATTDNGVTWTQVGDIGTGENWYNENIGGSCYPDITAAWKNISTNDWMHVRHNINDLTGNSSVKFMLLFDGCENWPQHNGAAFDNFSISAPPDNDLKVLSLDAPANGTGFGTSETITVSVANEGLLDATAYDISYSLDGGNTWTTDNITTTIISGSTGQINLPTTANFENIAEYNIIIAANIAGDGYSANDTLSTSFLHFAPGIIENARYLEDFEADHGWFAGGQNSSWEVATPDYGDLTGAPMNEKAWVTNALGPHNYNEISMVYSPVFDLSAMVRPFLQFIYKSILNGDDGAQLQYSTDMGATWQRVDDPGVELRYNWEFGGISALSYLGNNGGWVGERNWNTWAGHELNFIGDLTSVVFRFVFATSCDNESCIREGFTFDFFQIMDKAYDVRPVQIIEPVSGSDLGETTFNIEFKNRGLNSVNNIPFRLFVNESLVLEEQYTGTVDPDQTVQYQTTGTYNFSSYGEYGIQVVSTYPDALIWWGDTLNTTIVNAPVINTFPYTEDFETNQYWSVSGNNPSWELGTPAGSRLNEALSGINAWATGLEGTYNGNELSFVTSPAFDFSTVDYPVLSFWYWSDMSPEKALTLQYSFDGINWYIIDSWRFMPGLELWSGRLSELGDGSGIGGRTRKWNKIHINADFLAYESNVQFRFAFGADNYIDPVDEGITIDDFSIVNGNQVDIEATDLVPHSNFGNIEGEPGYLELSFVNNGAQIDELYGRFGLQIDDGSIEYFDETLWIGPVEFTSRTVWSEISALSPGIHEFKAWLDYGDSNTENDTIIKQIFIPGTHAGEYFEDFEGDGTGWTFNTEDYFTSRYPGWSFGMPEDNRLNNAYSGSGSLHTTAGPVSWKGFYFAYLPELDLTGMTHAAISFIMKRDLRNADQLLILQYSLDEGQSWHPVGETGDTLNWYQAHDSWLDDSYGNKSWTNAEDADWIKASHLLPEVSDRNNVRLRFGYLSWDNWESSEGIAIDDLHIYDLEADYDLSVNDVLLSSTCDYSSPVDISVTIKNIGINDVSSYDIHYSINGGTTVTNTITDALPAGSETTLMFDTPADFSVTGTVYELRIWTDLPEDGFSNNDEITQTVVSQPVVSVFDYIQDFESNTDGWTIYGNNPSLTHGTPYNAEVNYPYGGSGMSLETNPDGQYNDNEISILESGCFDFSGLIMPEIRFAYWLFTHDADDGFLLQYSTDGGRSWFAPDLTPAELWLFDNSSAARSAGLPFIWTGTMNDWRNSSFDLSPLAGEPSVKFRFVFVSDEGDNWDGLALDNIEVTEAAEYLTFAEYGGTINAFDDEAVWTGLTEKQIIGHLDPADISGTLKYFWDKDYMYFFVSITDDDLVNYGEEHPNSWENDNFEIYFDLANNGGPAYDTDGRQYRISWGIDFLDGRMYNPSGVEHAQRTDGNTWYEEMRIPFSDLLSPVGYEAVNGTMFSFDFRIADNDFDMAEMEAIDLYGSHWEDTDPARPLILDGRPPINLDIRVLSIDNINSYYCSNINQQIEFTITNSGVSVVNDQVVELYLNDVLHDSKTIPVINPEDTLHIMFDLPVDITAVEMLETTEIRIIAELAGDEYPENNEVLGNIKIYGPTDLDPGWSHIGVCDGLPFQATYGIADDAAGNLYIAHWGEGLARYDGMVMEHLDPATTGFASNDIKRVYKDSQSRIWFLHTGDFSGVSMFNGTDWFIFGSDTYDMATGNYNDAVETADGAVWFGTNDGLSRYDTEGNWSSNYEHNGIIALTAYHDGSLLVSSYSELYKFDGISNWEHLYSNSEGRTIYSVDAADNGEIWLAAYFSGLFHYDNSNWIHLDNGVEPGLTNSVSVKIIDENNIWIACYNAGFKYYSNGSFFDMSENFISNRLWARIFIDDNGKVYFPTYEGVTMRDPMHVEVLDLYGEASCDGLDDGWIIFEAIGDEILEYSIDGGTTFQAEPVFTGLVAGTYNPVVRNVNETKVLDPLTISTSPVTTDIPIIEDFSADTPGSIPLNSIFRNLDQNDYNWIVYQGGDENPNTGPEADHTTGSGNYLSLVADGNSYKSGSVISECIDISTMLAPAMRFWYHMYGNNSANLRIDIYHDGIIEENVWTTEGDHGPEWHEASVGLDGYGDVIRIIIHGDNYGINGDIALDDITIDDELIQLPFAEYEGTVDAVEDEAVWAGLTPVEVLSDWMDPADISASFKYFWDRDYLYFFVAVTDDNLQNNNEPDNDDKFELLFDIMNDGGTGWDYRNWNCQFIYGSNELHGHYPENIEYAQRTEGNTWYEEVRIPLMDLFVGTDLLPLNGTMFSFDFRVPDNDDYNFEEISLFGSNPDDLNPARVIMLEGRPPIAYDLGIETVNIAEPFYCQPDPQPVEFIISNNGGNAVENQEIELYINDVLYTTKSISLINPGEQLTVPFNLLVDLSTDMIYERFFAKVVVNHPDDEMPHNNENQAVFNVYDDSNYNPGWSYLGQCQGLPSDGITGVVVDDNGDVWIGINGLYKWDGVSFTEYLAENSDLASNYIEKMFMDDQGRIWILYWRDFNGVSVIDNGVWTTYSSDIYDMAPGDYEEAVQEPDGTIWFATTQGLSRFDTGGDWTSFTDYGACYGIAVDQSGNILFSSGSKLYSFNKTDTYTELFDAGNYIYEVETSSSGEIWLGTYGGGVYRFNGTDWENFNSATTGADIDRVFSIYPVDEQNVWIGTFGSGYYLYNGTEFIDFSDNFVNKYSWGNIFIDDNGKIYFPTYDGLTMKISAHIDVSNVMAAAPSCSGDSDGWIRIIAAGDAALEYSIDNGSTFQAEPLFEGLAEGTYNPVVRNVNDIKVLDPVTLTSRPTLSIFPVFDDFTAETIAEVPSAGLIMNKVGEEIQWKVWEGETPTPDTGPAGDHTTGDGKYIFLRSSGNEGKTGVAVTNCLDITTLATPTLEFWCNMWGENSGSFHVDIYSEGAWIENVWQVYGWQVQDWQQAQVDLSGYGNVVKIAFRGTNNGYKGDIALDDIHIYSSPVASIAEVGIADEGTTFVLDGSGSVDGQLGADLDYQWIVSSQVQISDSAIPDPTITLPVVNRPTDIEVNLQVMDRGTGIWSELATIFITVNDLSNTPVFTTDPVTEATIGDLYEYRFDVTDADGDALTVTSDLPAWLGISDQVPGSIEVIAGSSEVSEIFYPIKLEPIGSDEFIIADYSGNRIWKMDAAGNLSILAGTGNAGYTGDGGPAVDAELYTPYQVIMDNDGNYLVADFYNHVVRKIGTDGIISTIAGTGENGIGPDYVQATESPLSGPYSLACDALNNIYIGELYGHRIRMIDAVTGEIITLAGNGLWNFTPDGEPALDNPIARPAALRWYDGELWFADAGNNRIRKINTDGTLFTIAGDGSDSNDPYNCGDGNQAIYASIANPRDFVRDAAGEIYIAEPWARRIRKIRTDGIIETFYHNWAQGYIGDGGLFQDALIYNPYGLAVDNGYLYLADNTNKAVRKVDLSTNIITTANNASHGYSGDGGPALDAKLNGSEGVGVLSDGSIVVSDYFNNAIRKIDNSGIISTYAGTAYPGYSGDGGPAQDAELNRPGALMVGQNNDVYFADFYNHRIRKIDHATGIINTIAGTGITDYNGDGMDATMTNLHGPYSMDFSSDGSLYFIEVNNRLIRKLGTDGIIYNILGIPGESSYTGDNGPANMATMGASYGLTVTIDDEIIFSDYQNNVVRKIDNSGIVTTIAGTGERGDLGDGGPAVNAQLYMPLHITDDVYGNLYIHQYNGKIRKITPSGIITTVIGLGDDPAGFNLLPGDPVNSTIGTSYSSCFDNDGKLIISLSDASNVIKVSTESYLLSGVPQPTDVYDKHVDLYASDAGETATQSFEIDIQGTPDASYNLSLSAGWNIFSTPVLPQTTDMLQLFEPLISDGQLIKMQDETGAALEYLSGTGWINNIGDIKPSEGYKVKVSEGTNLTYDGYTIGLPYDISLSAGWNIIGFPKMGTENVTDVFSGWTEAILTKVQDERGAAYEYIAALSSWVDQIGAFTDGEGYKVNVPSGVTLTIAAGKKSGIIKGSSTRDPIHFKPAFEGNGTGHMNIYVKYEGDGGLAAGDEIAVLDGDICVGVAVIENTDAELYSVIASQDDPLTDFKDGFTEGTEISIRYWLKQSDSENTMYGLVPVEGYTDSFIQDGTTILKGGMATDLDDLAFTNTGLGNVYPHPVTERAHYSFYLANESRVIMEVYDALGRKITTLFDLTLPQGQYNRIWDRDDSSGRRVMPGIYYLKMSTDKYSASRKIIVQ